MEDGLILFRRPTEGSEIEHEIEYNIASGNHDWAYGLQYNCGGSYGIGTGCTNETFCASNFVLAPDSFPGSKCSDSETLTAGHWFTKGNFLVADDDTGLAGGTVNGAWSEDWWNHTWPFTVSPGLFSNRQSVWGRFAMSAGRRASVGTAPLVLPGSSTELAARVNAITSNVEKVDDGFRIELLGDLIVDCGHQPIHTEIHPPVGAVLHLGAGGASAGRFSLFGFHRLKPESKGPLVIDLWPSNVRGSAGTSIKAKPAVDGFVQKPPGSPDWICEPFPAAAPNRVRCTLPIGTGTSETDGCDDAPGFRPACATSISGALVDLSWEGL